MIPISQMRALRVTCARVHAHLGTGVNTQCVHALPPSCPPWACAGPGRFSCVHTYVHTPVYMCVRAMRTYMYMYVCPPARTYTCVHMLCMHICMRRYTHMHTCKHTDARTRAPAELRDTPVRSSPPQQSLGTDQARVGAIGERPHSLSL